MQDCGRGIRNNHTELIPYIQKNGPALSLPARKNPSDPKDVFGILGLAGGGS